jgi:hypothetical protein
LKIRINQSGDVHITIIQLPSDCCIGQCAVLTNGKGLWSSFELKDTIRLTMNKEKWDGKQKQQKWRAGRHAAFRAKAEMNERCHTCHSCLFPPCTAPVSSSLQ